MPSTEMSQSGSEESGVAKGVLVGLVATSLVLVLAYQAVALFTC